MIENVGEAAHWVWTKIKLGWDKLLDFVGHFFGWTDIKNTSNDIYDLLVGSIDWASDGLINVEDNVNGFFTNLKALIHVPNLPESATEQGNGAKSSAADASQSPAFNYLTERLKNGGLSSIRSASPSTTTNSTDDALAAILEPLGADIMDLAKNLTHDIAGLFHNEGQLTPAQLFARLGQDVLVNTITVVQQVVVGLIKLVRKLIGALKDAVTGKLRITLLSALYKQVTGDDLDWFKLVAFVLGFMTCTMSKIVTQKAPPRLNKPGKEMLSTIFNGSASQTEKQGNALFFSSVSLSISTVKLVYDTYKVKQDVDKVGAKTEAFTRSQTGYLGIGLEFAHLVCAFPTDRDAPGYDIRVAIMWLGAARMGMDIASQMNPEQSEDAREAVAVFDFIIDLINGCLYGLVFARELESDATAWKDKDDELTECAIAEDVLTTVKSGGKTLCALAPKFPAHEQVAAVGLTVMAGANIGLDIDKGFTLNRTAEVNPQCYRGVVC